VPYCCLIVGDAGYANPDATEFGFIDLPDMLEGCEQRAGAVRPSVLLLREIFVRR
jgi:hypothetical protein